MAFKNKRKHIYVSLTAADYPRVRPYLHALENEGYTIVHDYMGRAWSSFNARSIDASCAYIVFFSTNCIENAKIKSEINYAATHNIPFISVHLDAVPITSGIRRIFDSGNSVLAYNLQRPEACTELMRLVSSCMGSEKRHIRRALIVAVAASLVIIAGGITAVNLFNRAQYNVQAEKATVSSHDLRAADTGSTVEIAVQNVPPETEPVIINVYSIFGKEDYSAGAYSKLFASYTEQYPEAIFKDQSIADYDEYSAALMSSFETDNEPDVFMVYYDMFSNMSVANKNKITDVDTIQRTFTEYAQDIYPFALESVRDSTTEEIYAVPVRGYWEGLYCNEDLFTENSIGLPTDWTTFNAAVEAFSNSEITPVAASLGIVPQYWADYLILSAAGREEYEKFPANYAEVPASWLTGLDFFKTLFDKKAFPKNAETILDSEVSHLFIRKKAAMKLDGSWFCQAVGSTANVTVVSFPTVPGGAKSPDDIIGGYSVGWCISQKAWNNAQKRDYCIGLIKYLTKGENLEKFCGASGAPAGKITFSESTPAVVKAGAHMIEQAQGGKSFISPMKERLTQFSKVYPEVYGIASGETTSEKAMKKAFE